MSRPRTWKQDALNLAINAYHSGQSARTVQKTFGIPITSLLRACRAAGVPIRASGCSGLRRDLHPTWRGGFFIDTDGYTRTYDPNHPWPRKSGYVFEHVRVMELNLNRRLAPFESVHHKDHNKQNNELANLELTTRSAHSKHHRRLDTHKRHRNRLGQFA